MRRKEGRWKKGKERKEKIEKEGTKEGKKEGERKRRQTGRQASIPTDLAPEARTQKKRTTDDRLRYHSEKDAGIERSHSGQNLPSLGERINSETKVDVYKKWGTSQPQPLQQKLHFSQRRIFCGLKRGA